MGKLVLCIPACPLSASVPLCIQNELQLIKNKPSKTCNICIRFQSVGEKNVISPQQNIKEKEKKLKTCDQFFEIFFLQRYFLIVPTASALGGVTKFMVFKRLENIGVNLLMAFKLACTIRFIPLCSCLKCSIYIILKLGFETVRRGVDIRGNSLSALSIGAWSEFVGATGHPILGGDKTRFWRRLSCKQEKND